MHGVVLLAVFAFCLVLALAVAARRPLLGAARPARGAGWPATLSRATGVAFGAVVLAAALWLLAGLRVDASDARARGRCALVVVAAAASRPRRRSRRTASSTGSGGTLRPPGEPVSVRYVWDANYGGIDFPEKETTVLRIRGRSAASTGARRRSTASPRPLDREPAVSLRRESRNGRLPDDPLLPPRRRRASTGSRQEVEVVALARRAPRRARRTPVALEAAGARPRRPPLGRRRRASTASSSADRRYTVDSYAPRAEPAQLAAHRRRLPAGARPATSTSSRTRRAAVRRAPGARATVEALFDGRALPAALAVRGPLPRRPSGCAAGARTPYGAVVALETWLRATGGFAYDEQPPSRGGAPPLATSSTEGKRGYCQHFAGAMALMLRFLGIPARVAAGFTSGQPTRDGVWTVTDHNAHTWVEVWFPGCGWLPFDPTPGRGALDRDLQRLVDGVQRRRRRPTVPSAPAGRAARPGRRGRARRLTLLKEQRPGGEPAGRRSRDDGRRAPLARCSRCSSPRRSRSALAKLLRRRSRYLTRDPRRLAAAARRELADFLADQGSPCRPSATPDELRQLVREELGVDAGPSPPRSPQARYGPPGRSAARRRPRAERAARAPAADPAQPRPPQRAARLRRAPLAARVSRVTPPS